MMTGVAGPLSRRADCAAAGRETTCGVLSESACATPLVALALAAGAPP